MLTTEAAPLAEHLAREIVLRSRRADEPNSNPRLSQQKVVRFKEVVPSIFFPEQVEFRNSGGDGPDSTIVVSFSNIRINQPLPPDVFDFPTIPAGARVVDDIKAESYIADAHGNPKSGTVETLVRLPPIPAGSAQPTESVDEPKSLTRWILPGSLAVLALAGGLWLFRKWRPAAAGKTERAHS